MFGKKKELTLQRLTATTNPIGGQTFSWQSIRRIKGALIPLPAREQMMTGKEDVVADYKFCIDYPIGITITEKDRFVLGTRTFEVVFCLNPAENDVFLVLGLKEAK